MVAKDGQTFFFYLLSIAALSLAKLSSLMACSIRQGVPLRGGKADACAKEHFGKKAMAFIDADSDGTTSIRQAETVAFIDRYVAVLSELFMVMLTLAWKCPCAGPAARRAPRPVPVPAGAAPPDNPPAALPGAVCLLTGCCPDRRCRGGHPPAQVRPRARGILPPAFAGCRSPWAFPARRCAILEDKQIVAERTGEVQLVKDRQHVFFRPAMTSISSHW